MKKEMLRAIEEAKTLDEAILDLYKLAVPDFDARTTVKPPAASYATNLALINGLKNKFGAKAHVAMMWVNYRFSTQDNLPDWTFQIRG